MPKIPPVPDELSKPFWDAVNDEKLVVQKCTKCATLHYPPRQVCDDCGNTSFTWHQTNGRGHIIEFVVIQDSHLPMREYDQPFNLALISLDEDPRINFYSNLPGVEPFKVPVGSPVEVMFEEVAPGQLIHEWRLAT